MKNLKNNCTTPDVCMADGQYRDTAASQYLLREIIGEDNYNAGHLVAGEDHLRETFDNVAGEGKYDEIFATEKDPVTGEWVDTVGDAEKIKTLKQIFIKIEKDPRIRQIIDENTERITDYGKIDLGKQEEAEVIRKERRLVV